VFFPSHDIALANGIRHFNPPAAALRLQEDLASLSDVWNQPYLHGEAPYPQPWGWDWDTRRWLHDQYHVTYDRLPNDADLAEIRRLSSRQVMIPLIERIQALLPDSCATWREAMHTPTLLQSEEELRAYIDAHDTASLPFVLKTPWSSSGRGLIVSQVLSANGTPVPSDRPTMLRHALSSIRRMGSIMGEEWIVGKQHDFALLFHASSHEVTFLGYSLFDNDDSSGGTTYRQGYLLSNAAIEQRLHLPIDPLHDLIEACRLALTDLLQPLLGRPWCLGYLGIDMLSYASKPHNLITSKPQNLITSKPQNLITSKPHNLITSKPHNLIAPLELNLRTTMGTVCRLYYDQHPAEGLFHITPMQSDGHFKAEFLTSE